MIMLERAIAAAANTVGADPQDLRWLATGARLREWQPGEWLFHELSRGDRQLGAGGEPAIRNLRVLDPAFGLLLG